MQRCDFRSERECSCAPNECRVQMVYRTNDMTGVFTVPARWQYGLVFIFLALGMWWAVIESAPHHKAMELATQESGR